MNAKQIFEKFVLPTIVLIAGIAFLITGISKLVKVNTYPTTTAEITHIEVIYRGVDEPDDYEVTVKYAVEGTIYEKELDTYKSNFEEGKSITIHYNPENPEEITGLSSGSSIIIMVVGLVFTVAGAALWLRTLRGRAA